MSDPKPAPPKPPKAQQNRKPRPDYAKYEYRIEPDAVNTMELTFKTLGAQGWRYAGSLANGKVVFERPL
jgi:hypothetical protein